MKSGSTSIERQEETHAPHWMQAISWVTSTIASGSTTYSRSGGSPAGSSQGVTRRIFSQCVDSMSVTRSLTTGMFPIGSTTIGLAAPLPALSGGGNSPAPRGGLSASGFERRLAAACASPICVLQARVEEPLIFTPQEPQIAARQEQRTDSDPSSRSRACRIPSRTERDSSRSTSKVSQ
jgi:hypothetical protein